jgi:pyruvate kinase
MVGRLDNAGVDLFRINLSHMPIEKVEAAIDRVQRASSKPLCLDLHGAQVRCGSMDPGVVLHKGESIRLTAATVQGTAQELTLWPRATFAALQTGSLVSIDFDGAQLEIVGTGQGYADAVVTDGGHVRSNKAVTVYPAPTLPVLTDWDREAIAIGVRRGISHVALSFASSPQRTSTWSARSCHRPG